MEHINCTERSYPNENTAEEKKWLRAEKSDVGYSVIYDAALPQLQKGTKNFPPWQSIFLKKNFAHINDHPAMSLQKIYMLHGYLSE